MENFLENFLRFVEKNKSSVNYDCNTPAVISRYVVRSLVEKKSVAVIEKNAHLGSVYSVYLINEKDSVSITDRITQADAKTAYDTLKSIVDGRSESNRKSFIDKFFQ